MNAITTQSSADLLRVMRDSLYPGARLESVEMALAYCKARGLDPMLKPVHIVPMWVKDANGQDGMRDVPLPGIALYRIQAARSGEYAGKSEPEFGPDVTRMLGGREMTFPAWCKITVLRGTASFTAKEFWMENYATAKKDTDAPNAMWRKRPYGQLAKVAEAQALRMAFPELTGGEVTGEEMEGKSHEPAMPPARGPVLEAAPEEPREELPLIGPDGVLYAVRSNGRPAIDRWVLKATNAASIVSQDGKDALRDWRQANGVHFGSIAQTYPDQVAEVERYIEAVRFAPVPEPTHD